MAQPEPAAGQGGTAGLDAGRPDPVRRSAGHRAQPAGTDVPTARETSPARSRSSANVPGLSRALPRTFRAHDVDAERLFGRAFNQLTREEQAWLEMSSPDRTVNLHVPGIRLRPARQRDERVLGLARVGRHATTSTSDALLVYDTGDAAAEQRAANHELGHLLVERLLAGDTSGLATSATDEIKALADADRSLRAALIHEHPTIAELFMQPTPKGPAATVPLAEVLAILYETPLGTPGRLPDRPQLRRLREQLRALALYQTQGF